MTRSKLVEVVENPKVDFSLFDYQRRSEGISGFMRLRNEGEFLALSIESWLPLLDELVIVYNNCQDNTEAVVSEYAERYPKKIKAFHYLPEVYPQGSQKYKDLDENHQQSLVCYYNFALSKTTKRWAIKIDGDLVIPSNYSVSKSSVLLDSYNYMRENDMDSVLPLSGINIIDHGGRLFVPNSFPYCGLYGDLCLFRVDVDSVFKKGVECEFLDLSKRLKKSNIFYYFHLKFMKNDYGIGNYDFVNNPNSRYYPKHLIFLTFLKLIPLNDVLSETNMPLVSCQDFNINRIRNYKLDAKKFLSKQGVDLSYKLLFAEMGIYLKMQFLKKMFRIKRAIFK